MAPTRNRFRSSPMVRVEMARWGQSLDDLRRASLRAAHPRSRERFQALYLIASGRLNATARAAHIGRQDETVLRWAHLYNRHGPEALAYRHSGGRAPLLPSSRSNGSLRRWKPPTPPPTACPAITGP